MPKKHKSSNLSELQKRTAQQLEKNRAKTLYLDGSGSVFKFRKARIRGMNCYEMPV